MNGPVASHLVLLDDLDGHAPGTKVRFLGCVDKYCVETATLRLKHDYPPSGSPKTANVNVEHLLESSSRIAFEVGSWINVIGYLERRNQKGIFVQAVAVWDAGNIDLTAYQKAVQMRKNAA